MHSKTFHDLEHRLIQTISYSSHQATMLEEITSILGKTLPADFCLIVAGIDSLQTFQFASWTNQKSLDFSPKIVSDFLSLPWIKDLIEQPQMQAIADLEKASSTLTFSKIDELTLGSLLVISTSFQEKVNGIVFLGMTQPYRWTKQQKALLKESSNILAIACHLTQLPTLHPDHNITDKESSLSLNNLPQLLDENPILKIWWEATRKQLERQLEWNKQLIYNLITIMSDQTRNPLAIIKMGITMLRQKEMSSEDLQKRLDILDQEWNKLNDINQKILQLKTLKSQELTLSPNLANLETLIDKIITPYQQEWRENQRQSLTLAVNLEELSIPSREIYTDAEYLKDILQELLINAGKFSLPNSTASLTITEQNYKNNPTITISITNLSRCILQKNLKYLFDPFYREQMVIDTAIPGIGLGLTIVKDLVELLNGKIEVVSETTEIPEHCKITFRLILPQSLS